MKFNPNIVQPKLNRWSQPTENVGKDSIQMVPTNRQVQEPNASTIVNSERVFPQLDTIKNSAIPSFNLMSSPKLLTTILLSILALPIIGAAVAAGVIVALSTKSTVTNATTGVNTSSTWQVTGSMSIGRDSHTASMLQNGLILVCGGSSSSSSALNSAELYNATSGTWTPTGSMGIDRKRHTATVLLNGYVLVAGGNDGTGSGGNQLNSAELYNPNTGTWTMTGSMTTSRDYHTASRLSNGSVLVVGGMDGTTQNTAELYDPGSGAWTYAPNMSTRRKYHAACALLDGTVLVMGGDYGGSGTYTQSTAEIYNPTSGVWTSTQSMNDNRKYHTANLLSDGRVLVIGGDSGASGWSTLNSAEIYDPAAGNWTRIANMSIARQQHGTSILANGSVVVSGGCGCASGSSNCTSISCGSGNMYLSSVELYSFTNGNWTSTISLNFARVHHTSLLVNARILVSGGSNSSAIASAELL